MSYFPLPVIDPKSLLKNVLPAEIERAIKDPSFKFLVAFSGGKDSVAMVLRLLDLGVPKSRIILHHHEVDGGAGNYFDWVCTTSYCKAFAEAFGIEILFSYREGGIGREIHRENEGLQDVLYQRSQGDDFLRLESNPGNTTRKKFPAVSVSLTSRWCSAVVKIDVMERVLRNNPDYKTGNFIVCTGERREESPNRAKYHQLETHKANTKSRTVLTWRPVIDWTESDVWSIYKRYKVQAHPCYCLGWSRCSCQLCIFSSANTWASILEIAPEKVYKIREDEISLGFTLYKEEDIITKAERGTSFIRAEDLDRWKEEATGEFTSPIFVDTWTLPSGAFGGERAGAF